MTQIPDIAIRPEHWEIVRNILSRHVPRVEVWAFGSRTGNSPKLFSDLDLAVVTVTPLPLATLASLTADFTESDLPFKVDVVDWASTDERFRGIIARDKVVVQRGDDKPA